MLQAGFLLLTIVSVLATSFLSGVFGMAGGMILMGVLVAFMPVSAAMVLHGAAQLTANGWRAFLWRRNSDFRIFGRFLVGLLAAALYDPVFTEGVTGPHSLVIVAVAFVALTAWKAPAWAVVLGAAGLGALLL